MRLGAVVITYNEEAHITACLDSLRFADEHLVFDSFSTDRTVPLAEAWGARVLQRPFDHYAGQRNAALEAMAGRVDWVLFVDADERIPAALAEEVRDALRTDAAGYQIPRDNILFGRLTRGAGWWPDYQTRLLRLGRAHYDPQRQVHEVVVLEGPLGTLQNAITHYNYRDVAQFIQKQRRYTAYDAQILYNQGYRPRPHQYLTLPLRHFWWRFVTLRGWRDGLHGLRLSALMAWYELRKLQQVAALARQEARPG